MSGPKPDPASSAAKWRTVSGYTWEDIVLSDDLLAQLHELTAQVANRNRVYEKWGFGARLDRGRGISALFAGLSGTGKTMAAEVIANALQLDLYRIDLSGVVSKYIGETEKNLKQVFENWQEAATMLDDHARSGQPLTQEELKRAHDAAMAWKPEATPGKLRAENVMAGGTLGIARMWTALSAAQQATLRRLVSIHPFLDGNGRVSRLVMDDALQQSGLPPALLTDPSLDFMVTKKEWIAEVRAGVVEAYHTTARHADIFNTAIKQLDGRTAAATWAMILGLTSDPDALIGWLYPDSATSGETAPP